MGKIVEFLYEKELQDHELIFHNLREKIIQINGKGRSFYRIARKIDGAVGE